MTIDETINRFMGLREGICKNQCVGDKFCSDCAELFVFVAANIEKKIEKRRAEHKNKIEGIKL